MCQYVADYVKLYVDTIRSNILKLDKSRAFIVSSPSNGVDSEAVGYIAKNPQDEWSGDVHYYNYKDNW
jgi:beta-mannosidase